MRYVSMLRWILNLGLCYGVYTETGIWTTLTIFLFITAFEIRGYSEKEIK